MHALPSTSINQTPINFLLKNIYFLVLQKLNQNCKYLTYLDFSTVLQWALADMAFCLVGCFN